MSVGTERTAAIEDRTYGPEDGILVVKDLTKQFGGLTAVDSLSFTVQPGEILGFIGPNGAGKSTTFNCITGDLAPTDGTVWYRGEDVTKDPPYRMVDHGLARTFQSFEPLRDRSVVRNVRLALASNNLITLPDPDDQIEEDAIEICRQVGLGDVLHQTPDELPHAGLIRVELARAIATKPDLMLIDEAFAGLTAEEITELIDLLESLRDGGMTLIIVDHNMHGLLEVIDRGIVIQFGAKIAEGTPEQIKNDSKVQEAYLGGLEV